MAKKQTNVKHIKQPIQEITLYFVKLVIFITCDCENLFLNGLSIFL